MLIYTTLHNLLRGILRTQTYTHTVVKHCCSVRRKRQEGGRRGEGKT
jgi:hypothetical protein